MRVLKWAANIFLLFLIFAGGAAFLIEIPFRLAFGWISFLRNNVASLELNPLRVAEAVACIAALGVGGHFFARWLYRQMAPAAARPWRPEWTAAGLGAVLLLFVAGVGTIGITHQTAWLFTDPGPLITDSMGYVKRAKVSEAILAASPARTLVTEIFEKTGRLPDIEVASPQAQPETRYAKKISIRSGGVIHIEIADVIEKDGVITLTPTPKNGTLEWKCGALAIQKLYLPAVCRQ
jgi:hypothetical protein